jgi:hypothetical protein
MKLYVIIYKKNRKINYLFFYERDNSEANYFAQILVERHELYHSDEINIYAFQGNKLNKIR